MEIESFIENFREAFGETTELPILFWYTEEALYPTEKIPGCFFKGLKQVREGGAISLSDEVVTCGGGKFYCGFSEPAPHIANFVSLKERYKKTPDMVREFMNALNWEISDKKYLNFARIDRVESFDNIEGVLFFATPDVLSGLTTWAFFDNNADDTVSTVFGSGCGVVVTQTILENRKGGYRTFLGLFDPSVRPYVEADILSFTIPMSRFKIMYNTMRDSCLFDTHAWAKVRERIQNSI